MSDKLVIEFYEEENPSKPLLAVIALHGGDNPLSASLTIGDFVASTRHSWAAQDHCDAYVLASQFLQWCAMRHPDSSTPEAELTELSEKYGYQTARIYSAREHIRVELVRDEFTTDAEMIEGMRLLGPVCFVSAA